MKQLLLVFFIVASVKGFTQETIIKEKTKTKVEGPRYETKAVKRQETSTAREEMRANASAHAAYRARHARPVYKHSVIHRAHRHYTPHVNKKHHHPVKRHTHYKEIKRKHSKGKTKIKYEY